MRRHLALVTVCVILSTSVSVNVGCKKASSPSTNGTGAGSLSTPIVSPATTSPATCTAAAPASSSHDTTEAALLTLINTYRSPLAAGTQVNGDVGAAKWHASNMATNKYTGLVGTDGQDIFMRVRCGAAGSWIGTAQAIAVSGSSDPNAVMSALTANTSAAAALKRTPGTSISIGHNSGYWMIFII